MPIGKGLLAATIPEDELRQLVAASAREMSIDGRRVLIIVPDGTRTMPMPQMFRLQEEIGSRAAACDYLVALGTHPAMSDEQLTRHFGCPVVCGAPRNAILFRASDAQRPFVTRNAELLAMLAPQFEEELKQENADENFPERVRGAIQQKLTGRRPTIEDIAGALHISSRSLQRRLQDEGSNFQRVLEEARHQLARHYLNNSVLELNEAAYLLGYEDASSFVRAFRIWEGVPPSRWREQQRARAAS